MHHPGCRPRQEYLKTIKRTGLGFAAFAEMRYENPDDVAIEGAAVAVEKADFVLNREPYRNAVILVAGDNFGCGSSREHAPWAINGFGIRCIISTSFADIFYNNCFKNGMLPIELAQEQVRLVRVAAAVSTPGATRPTLHRSSSFSTMPARRSTSRWTCRRSA
jgi:3-isopropylmalate dehydratase small subunit